MSISKTLKRYYQNTASSMLLVFLMVGCGLADHLARTRLDPGNHTLASMDGHTMRQMRLIDFAHAHSWMVFVYVAVFLAFLLWLELRNAPRWSVWATFAMLALPALAYGSACLHVSKKLIFLTTTGA